MNSNTPKEKEFEWNEDMALKLINFIGEYEHGWPPQRVILEQFKSTHTPVPKSSHVSEGEKKDWEIVAYSHHSMSVDEYFYLQLNGNYVSTRFPDEYFSERLLLNNPNGKMYGIYQVKRLSDGEVFSIGDEVVHFQSNDDRGIIKSFEIKGTYDKWILVSFVGKSADSDHHVYTNHLKVLSKPAAVPVKEVLFVTQDGKNIYEGDEYWYIYPQWIVAQVLNAHGIMNGAIATFSTEQLAKEYVSTHRPVLSYEDVIECCNKPEIDDGAIYRELYDIIKVLNMEKLKQIIQQRLNK